MSGASKDLNARTPRSRRNILRTGAVGAVVGSIGFIKAAWGGTPPSAVSSIPPPVKCFLKGARILTVAGETRVEDLAVGDLLPTMFGGPRPIEWIGRYTLKRGTPSKPWPKDSQPVRIARSALAPSVPHADLYVSQAHAVLVDDVLISAGCLINGTTITLDEASERDTLEFFHIKLASHDVITAEGAPAETLLSVDESAANFADYFRRHGEPSEADVPCLPILSEYRQGSSLKARFRGAISWLDGRRRKAAIRDRLAERGRMLSRQSEPSA